MLTCKSSLYSLGISPLSDELFYQCMAYFLFNTFLMESLKTEIN